MTLVIILSYDFLQFFREFKLYSIEMLGDLFSPYSHYNNTRVMGYPHIQPVFNFCYRIQLFIKKSFTCFSRLLSSSQNRRRSPIMINSSNKHHEIPIIVHNPKLHWCFKPIRSLKTYPHTFWKAPISKHSLTLSVRVVLRLFLYVIWDWMFIRCKLIFYLVQWIFDWISCAKNAINLKTL